MRTRFKVESVSKHGHVNLVHLGVVFEHDEDVQAEKEVVDGAGQKHVVKLHDNDMNPLWQRQQKHFPTDHDWDHLRSECRGGAVHLTLYGDEAAKAFPLGSEHYLDFTPAPKAGA